MSHSRIRLLCLLRRLQQLVALRRGHCCCAVILLAASTLPLLWTPPTLAQVVLDGETSDYEPLIPLPVPDLQLEQEGLESIERPPGRPAVPGDVLDEAPLTVDGAPWSLNSGESVIYGAGYPIAEPDPLATRMLNLAPPGWSQPLYGTSWLNRPASFGWMLGSVSGDDPINGRVQQRNSVLGGYRLGWDFDHYWGSEVRLAFSHLRLDYNQIPGPSTAEHVYFDANVLYYPWGDSAWRPYFFAGLGWASFDFLDENQRRIEEVNLAIPFGLGLKYYFRKWLALRFSMTDNFSVGSDRTSPQHNLSWAVGAEMRYGGVKTSYFPFHPGGKMW